MNMENHGSNMLVLPDAGSWGIRKMFVTGDYVDPKTPAKGLNCVLENGACEQHLIFV